MANDSESLQAGASVPASFTSGPSLLEYAFVALPEVAEDVEAPAPGISRSNLAVYEDVPLVWSAPDSASDSPSDVATDTAPDAATDAAPDTATDAAPDAVTDVAPDAVPDADPDVATDVSPDAETDAEEPIEPLRVAAFRLHDHMVRLVRAARVFGVGRSFTTASLDACLSSYIDALVDDDALATCPPAARPCAVRVAMIVPDGQLVVAGIVPAGAHAAVDDAVPDAASHSTAPAVNVATAETAGSAANPAVADDPAAAHTTGSAADAPAPAVAAPSADASDAEKGLVVGISSWRHVSAACLPVAFGSTAREAALAPAAAEVNRADWDDAVLLNEAGLVCEALGGAVFSVRDGVLATPPQADGVRDTVMREVVLEMALDLEIPVVEESVDRSVLAASDEVFIAGDVAGIRPVRVFDGCLLTPVEASATSAKGGKKPCPSRSLEAGTWRPGAYTTALLERYRALLAMTFA